MSDIAEFLEKVKKTKDAALARFKEDGLVLKHDIMQIENGHEWEFSAFWLYTDLCDLDLVARHLLEDLQDE